MDVHQVHEHLMPSQLLKHEAESLLCRLFLLGAAEVQKWIHAFEHRREPFEALESEALCCRVREAVHNTLPKCGESGLALPAGIGRLLPDLYIQHPQIRSTIEQVAQDKQILHLVLWLGICDLGTDHTLVLGAEIKHRHDAQAARLLRYTSHLLVEPNLISGMAQILANEMPCGLTLGRLLQHQFEKRCSAPRDPYSVNGLFKSSRFHSAEFL
mmetsp:Transcript_58240/g.109729  ORF Transcript_58240/g.109729 Transcript_58240/m.109729 type:complete len:213 (-) Transcript_58240:349-987(-)